MELKVIEIRPFLKVYITTMLLAIVGILLSFLAVRYELALFSNSTPSPKVKNVLLLALVFLSFGISHHLNKQKQAMLRAETFEIKSQLYETYYRKRMMILCVSCLVSCLFYLFAQGGFFIYFAIIEMILLAISYPGRLLFEKELSEEDIILN